MSDINHLAIGVAAIAAFIVGAVWNSSLLFGRIQLELAGKQPGNASEAGIPAGQMLAELGRILIGAYVLAHLVSRLGITNWAGGVQLAGLTWLGFQAALVAGAVIWEGMKVQLYAIHMGDALVKILLVGGILGAWR